MIDINLEEIINVLGNPINKIGSELVWQCPYCMDKSKNNLMFNQIKGVLWCFANDKHASKLLTEIHKDKKIFYQATTYKQGVKEQNNTISDEKAQYFFDYMMQCNNLLLSSKEYLQLLQEKRGLTAETIRDCFIGIDLKKKCFVVPTIKFNTDSVIRVIGFEYRPLNLSKNGLYREKNAQTGMAQINHHTSKTIALVILEGYFDSYAFYQYLKEIEQDEFYHIATPSNGIASILKHVKAIESLFCHYKKIYAYLDSDTAGLEKMDAIKNIYPFIEIIKMNCGCKDFNEHYLSCISPSPLVENLGYQPQDRMNRFI